MFAAETFNLTAYSDAMVILGTAGVLIPIFRRWGLNPVLGYLALGATLGPMGLGSFSSSNPLLYWITITDAHSVAGIAELGIIFLLFLIGLELSMQRLLHMGRLVAGLGGLQVILCAAMLTAGMRAAGLAMQTAILLGVALALSSTAIVMELLARQGRVSTRTGKAVFAILLAQDMAAIPILMFVSISGASQGRSVLDGLLNALLQAAVAIAVIVVSSRLLLRPLFRMVASARSAELFIAAVLFVVVGSGLVAHLAGLSMAMGAFLAGLLLAETEFQKAIHGSIESFKGLLLGVFFFTVGMRIDLRELIREPLLLAACVLALVLLKSFVIVLLAKAFRFSWPTAIESGLLLSTGGEFAFVILGLAADLRLLDERVLALTLAVVAVSMAVTPTLAALAQRIRKFLGDRRPLAPELAVRPGHERHRAIVVGYGRVGKVVCSLFSQEGLPFLATDMNPKVVLEARNNGSEVYFGDPSEPEFLKACGLEEASSVILSIDEPDVVDSVVEFAHSFRPDLPIVARARDARHARRLFALGASEAFPETVEASLHLSEAALISVGVSAEEAAARVQRNRIEIGKNLRSALRGKPKPVDVTEDAE